MSETPKQEEKAPVKKRKRVARDKNSKYYIDNKEMLEEVRKSKAIYESNPELAGAALTPRLAEMFVLLVGHYGTKKNWIGYSYLEELKGEALVNLVNKWHKFDCEKYDKPFAYYSMLVERSFIGQIQKEKKPQKVRDAIITSRGEMPSFAAQEEHKKQMKEDMDAKEKWDKDQNDRFHDAEAAYEGKKPEDE